MPVRKMPAKCQRKTVRSPQRKTSGITLPKSLPKPGTDLQLTIAPELPKGLMVPVTCLRCGSSSLHMVLVTYAVMSDGRVKCLTCDGMKLAYDLEGRVLVIERRRVEG
jgi:hypothetical protein